MVKHAYPQVNAPAICNAFILAPASLLLLCWLAASQGLAIPQTATRDPQAVAIASRSLEALSGGAAINDLTLQGPATYTVGGDVETGAVSLLASGNLASRVTLRLTDGQRTEVRNGAAGDWIGTDGTAHAMALHNCWPDADWFYPGLSFQALNSDPGLGLAYVGLENKNGLAVQHLRLFRLVGSRSAAVVTAIQTLSAEDIYLDASSYLPRFLDFNLHPDDDFSRSIRVEIAFVGYQKVNGVAVPVRIQKYFNGGLLLDLSVASAGVNTGLPASDFHVTSTTGGTE